MNWILSSAFSPGLINKGLNSFSVIFMSFNLMRQSFERDLSMRLSLLESHTSSVSFLTTHLFEIRRSLLTLSSPTISFILILSKNSWSATCTKFAFKMSLDDLIGTPSLPKAQLMSRASHGKFVFSLITDLVSSLGILLTICLSSQNIGILQSLLFTFIKRCG